MSLLGKKVYTSILKRRTVSSTRAVQNGQLENLCLACRFRALTPSGTLGVTEGSVPPQPSRGGRVKSPNRKEEKHALRPPGGKSHPCPPTWGGAGSQSPTRLGLSEAPGQKGARAAAE